MWLVMGGCADSVDGAPWLFVDWVLQVVVKDC